MNIRPGAVCAFLFCVAGAAVAAPSTAVLTQVVRTQALANTVTAYGQLVPAPGALQWLSAAQAGRITAVLVSAGTEVKRGQGLVRIEPTPQTLAAYETARGELAAARAKLKQTRALVSGGLATQADLAAAEGSVAGAKARLTALQASGVGSHARVLKASAAGVVTRLSVSRGEWVGAGARIAALAPRGALWVRLGLAPAAAAAVKSGAKVRLTPVFGSGKPLLSRVARVDAQADPATGLIDVEVPVPAGPAGPFPGEWVAGEITLHRSKLPAVRRSAVLKDAHGYYVFVVRHGSAHRVSVRPVIRARGLVGLEGLKPGATVVIQGNFELSDGAAVRVTGRQDSGS